MKQRPTYDSAERLHGEVGRTESKLSDRIPPSSNSQNQPHISLRLGISDGDGDGNGN